MKPNEIIQNKTELILRSPGIYMVLCITSGKAYVGQSKNLYKRLQAHKNDLKANRHRNIHLQRSYNKYGKESLSYFILENCQENLTERESYWLELIDKDLRLNLAKVTDKNPMSQETKDKLSKINMGNKHCLGKKNGLGYKHTPEAKAKIAEASKNRSMETRKKLSESAKKQWEVRHGRS